MEVREEEKRRNTGTGVDLQSRDVDLLLYLNEMGWGQADILCMRFFCKRPEEFNEGRLKTAKRRLWILQEAGYLRTFRVANAPLCFFVTNKGVQVLEQKRPHVIHLKSMKGLYLSLNEHTKRIHWARIALEFSGQCKGWRSERRLKVDDFVAQHKVFQGAYHAYMPDGVYLNQDNKKVLFELEHAEKTKKQVDEKLGQIDRLLDLMPDRYQACHIVSTTKTMRDKYKERMKHNYYVSEFNEVLLQGGLNVRSLV